jgi:L-ascorbate metabolism protein UlaG (beta-lactamase superfamily)
VKITYYGHSAFLLESADGTRVILDPYRSGAYGGALRYGPIGESAEVVVATHEHDDHGATDTIPGAGHVFVHPTSAQVGPWRITGVDVYHDAERGKSRGRNTIVILDDGELRVVHLGDLGHTLAADTVRTIGSVDVLLVPVGGHFTIDHKQAATVVDSLSPRVVIPMHYKTDKVDFPIGPVEAFLATQDKVQREDEATIELSRETLPAERTTIVLTPAR